AVFGGAFSGDGDLLVEQRLHRGRGNVVLVSDGGDAGHCGLIELKILRHLLRRGEGVVLWIGGDARDGSPGGDVVFTRTFTWQGGLRGQGVNVGFEQPADVLERRRTGRMRGKFIAQLRPPVL